MQPEATEMTSQFNSGALLAEYGDEELVADITQLFLDTATSQMQLILSAVTAGDAPALKAAAHRLRGAVATFGAETATELTQSLETMGATNQLNGAGALAERLSRAMQELCDGARAWLQERAA